VPSTPREHFACSSAAFPTAARPGQGENERGRLHLPDPEPQVPAVPYCIIQVVFDMKTRNQPNKNAAFQSRYFVLIQKKSTKNQKP
jgi:hypothetical protein